MLVARHWQVQNVEMKYDVMTNMWLGAASSRYQLIWVCCTGEGVPHTYIGPYQWLAFGCSWSCFKPPVVPDPGFAAFASSHLLPLLKPRCDIWLFRFFVLGKGRWHQVKNMRLQPYKRIELSLIISGCWLMIRRLF